MSNGLSANANKSLIASFAGMAGCFGCIAVAIFVNSKRKQAEELKDKSDDEIEAGTQTKTKNIQLGSATAGNSTTATQSFTKGAPSTLAMFPSVGVSIPSSTMYAPIDVQKITIGEEDENDYDNDEMIGVDHAMTVPMKPRKKKKTKRRKKKKRRRPKHATTKGMGYEEECALTATGGGTLQRESKLQAEFAKIKYDMDQMLKYGITPDGTRGSRGTKGYKQMKRGNIVAKV